MAELDLSINEIIALQSSVRANLLEIDDWKDKSNTKENNFSNALYDDLSKCMKKLNKAYQVELNNLVKDK